MLVASALLLFASIDSPARYGVLLDEQEPIVARFSLVVPAPEMQLTTSSASLAVFAAMPACGAAPLHRVAETLWLKPAGCRTVTWTARLADHDLAGIDAASPPGAWSRRNRLWILSASLPWLARRDQAPATARVRVRLTDGRLVRRSFRVTPGRGAPLTLVVGAGPVRRYRDRGFEMRVRGDVPRFDWLDPLQRQVARSWIRWRRDLLPAGTDSPDSLDFAWVAPAPDSSPGFFASTGSHAILMQYAPDPGAADPEAKLRAGLVLVGAHESFHAFLGALAGNRPAWVNESWASYFAYLAARRVLNGPSLALAEELVASPAASSLLEAQRLFDGGDSGQVSVFYGKGARFWAAVDAVLTTKPNRSGRLAALIRSTNGMRGLDWNDADRVAAYLDRHSGGRASAIVRCHLRGTGCPVPS